MKSNIPVNQMFLTLTKGKTIEDYPVYELGRDLFKRLTKKYKLFNDTTANNLMKQYPEFYDMWKNVRYEIMKVDILRFIILYHYGGFVSDLDNYPNIDNLGSIIGDGSKFIVYTPSRVFNYEALYSPKHNELCLDFVRYIKIQIQEKNKLKIYDTWKGRYVLQTTGPRSFKRFLDKYYKNSDMVQYVEVGTVLSPADVLNLKKNIKKFPFVSLQLSAWLSSIGSKEVYSHKEKEREALMEYFSQQL